MLIPISLLYIEILELKEKIVDFHGVVFILFNSPYFKFSCLAYIKTISPDTAGL